MECNKDDALRAKEIAEKKLSERDLAGAKVFAMKAQHLYPCLDGLPQMLATIEVLVSAEKKVNGEVDWYRVLGVPPMADDEMIRRRYRKLALTLHPDKNNLVGANGAFNLISEAWELLSDKAKRIIYNQKHNITGIFEGISGVKPSIPANQNGFFNIFNRANNWKDGNHKGGNHPNPTPGSPVTLKQSFWTMCSSCKIQFEYHADYINCTLTCNHCKNRFLAAEVPPPPGYSNVSSASKTSQMKQHNLKSTRMERNYYVSGRNPTSAVNSSLGSGLSSMPGGISTVPMSASSAAEAPRVFGMSPENLKRGREESTPFMRVETHFGKTQAVEITGTGSAFQSSYFGLSSVLKPNKSRKKMRTGGCKVSSDRREMEIGVASQNEGINLATQCGSQKGSLDKGRVNAAGSHKRNGFRDMPQLQIRNMLMEKARKEICRKLNEWSVSSASRNLVKSKNTDPEVREKDKGKARNVAKPSVQEFQEYADSVTIGNKCYSAASEVTDSHSMIVPDPDFHDFDNDRTEKAFGENQVWAVYDDDDGMPRYYALIHSVISKKPFKMKISWLNSKSNDEFAPIKWVSSGFPKTSGDFRVGKHGCNSNLNSFSHKVKWTKGLRGAVHLYPKKGDVWALYRNWSIDWNEFTEDEIIHKYDMVEVIEDYNEEQGVNVAPLVKVAGFKTVFCQNADPSKIRNIPKAEMFCFSHQVPSYLLTGKEGHNAPRGCLELDPASVPMELLEVVTEGPKKEMVMTTEKSLEDKLRNIENSMEDGLVERHQTRREEDYVREVPRKVVAKAMGKKESRPEILQVYQRKRKREKGVLQSGN